MSPFKRDVNPISAFAHDKNINSSLIDLSSIQPPSFVDFLLFLIFFLLGGGGGGGGV